MSSDDHQASTFSSEFDFEAWAKLYQDNPEQFEQQRKQWIADAIEAAPTTKQQRLVGLQFQIDAVRRTCHNPYQSTIKISTMMMDMLAKLNEALHGQVPATIKASVLSLHTSSNNNPD